MPDEPKIPTLEEVIKPVEPEAGDKPAAGGDATPATPSVSDTYKDKSLEEVVALAEEKTRSYDELRKLQSRQANELGEARRLADQLIQADLQKRTTGDGEATTKVELDLDDPDKATAAIERLIQARVEEALQSVNGAVKDLGRTTFEQKLAAAHTDWREVSTSQAFIDWISQSPARLANYEAATKGDYAYADDLLATYKALHKPADPATAGQTAEEKAATLKAATLESGSSTTPGTSKPTYRRSDIIHLRMTDPQRYNTLRSEIDLAYQEGRVTN